MAESEKLFEPVVPSAPAAAVPSSPSLPVPGAVVPLPEDAPAPPRRSPGHRGADVKDTVAEMAAKAHEISLEAGSRMAAAMKDVVNAAAGLSGFVMESARDLVQFMVRRGQMTQDEADKLISQVEEHQPKRKSVAAPAQVAGKSPTVSVKVPPVAVTPAPAAIKSFAGDAASGARSEQPRRAASEKAVSVRPVVVKGAPGISGAGVRTATKKAVGGGAKAAAKPAARKVAAKASKTGKPARKAVQGKAASSKAAQKKPPVKKSAAGKAVKSAPKRQSAVSSAKAKRR
ncbi:MAG: hypothetical protein WKF55_12720 [Gemmatimonadaceae bacterium]